MIVDMVRNDLGQLAVPGSVRVPTLFATERYETLWQLTSTVTAETDAPLPAIMQALFPCASITGAPKVRTCAIITELESTPRGIYTGAIGFVLPGGDAQFNVGIRTAHLDRRTGCMEYGTGGGITWDSTAEDEYEECLVKARVLTTPRPDFQLLETLRWKPAIGYVFLEEHLQRLADAASYFGFPVDLAEARGALAALAPNFISPHHQRVRLLVDEEGAIHCTATSLSAAPHRRWRVALADAPMVETNPFLYHKTTARAHYETARAAYPDMDDVLLWNSRGELTESTTANIVLRYHGRWLTPPVSCGLLAGVYRNLLLRADRIEEAILPLDMLADADALYLINSVRGWIPAVLEGA